ncbi:hypothetical protein AB4876_04295 [Zhongshania guokunii]|uniref:Tetratricopeptide repeat protein n=1 Tax=Zhongshania guokunii TaxID=641783 RepID=A0ABV3U2R4_9GAMM
MPRHLPTLTLLSSLALSACQSPANNAPASNNEQAELLSSLVFLESKQYQTAEPQLQNLLNSRSELVHQQALAALCLLYLQNQELNKATTKLDELYQRALREPQIDANLKMLRLSLQIGLENALRFNIENQARQVAEAQQLKLRNESQALQRAIEKLRHLSLQ